VKHYIAIMAKAIYYNYSVKPIIAIIYGKTFLDDDIL